MFFKSKQQQQTKNQEIILKSSGEINILRTANRLVAETFVVLEKAIRPGVSLRQLDKLAAEYLKTHDAQPLYKGYRGNPPTHPPFPGVICASVNQEVCHGLPDGRILQEGDIVGIDIGLRYKGFCGDACVTFGVGEISAEAKRLLKVTEECLYVGIKTAQAGRRLTDIGEAIQTHAEQHGFTVVEEWGGHGVGRTLHEGPSVSHVGPGGRGMRLRPGMVFTIEPMINAGKAENKLMPDGWTVITADGSLSAQFEHTLAITPQGTEILSRLS